MLHWINTKMLPSLFEITFKVVLEIIKSCSTTFKLKMIRNYQNNFGKVKSAMEYQKLHGNIIRIYHPSKHSSWWRRLNDVFKTSFVFVFRRRLQDVLIKTNMFTLALRLQKTSWSRPIYSSWPYVFKTSSRRLAKMSSRHLQDVFKTFSRRFQDVFKTSWQDVFKTSWDVFKTSFINVFKTSSRRLAKMSSMRFQDV